MHIEPFTAVWQRYLTWKLVPAVRICRHREWSKFGNYSEAVFCRLVDDLC